MESLPTLDVSLPREGIDDYAIHIVETLQRGGFVTYLVGGCVRDLLLGRSPKDFDIATMATPRDISRMFRNCRIIGRRFRLAHIQNAGEIYEVSTFRGRGAEAVSSPREQGDEFIERTNTFGTPQQDALSRDFTMNGLFYDPVEEKVIDYVNGAEDLEAHLVKTIGNPDARMEEDPVRILRAIKFSARLGFEVEENLQSAMRKHVPKILECPTPRVTEELFRLGESRCAEASFALLWEYGVMDALMPTLADHLDDVGPEGHNRFFRSLTWLDRMGKAHGSLPRDFVLSVLYLWPAWDRVTGDDQGGDWGKRIEDWFHEPGVRLQIPVRLRMRFYLLMAMVQRMVTPKTARRFRRIKPLIRQPAFPQALALLRLIHVTTGQFLDRYEWWRGQAEVMGVSAAPFAVPREKKDDKRGDERPPRRRRRQSRRRR
jgi:poly(A) polymerase